MYSGDVRFKNGEGELLDYDPSLVGITTEDIKTNKRLANYKFQNKEGDKKHYLPQKLTVDTPILMVNDSYEMAFRPVFANEEVKATELEQNDVVDQSIKAEKDTIKSEKIEQTLNDTEKDQKVDSVTDTE